MTSSDDLTGEGEAEAPVGDEVEDEPPEAGELGAVEDEHLRDEDPHEEAAHEPVVGGRPGAPDAQDAPADERRASDRRDDLPDGGDRRGLGWPAGGSRGGDERDADDRHRGVGDDADAHGPFGPRVRHELLVAISESPIDGRDEARSFLRLGQSGEVPLRELREWRLRVGKLEESLDPRPSVGLDRPLECSLQDIEGIRERFDLGEATLAEEGPGDKKRDDEQTVDQGDRGPVEVVVVRRDELPDLVDERAEAQSRDHRGKMLDGTVEEGLLYTSDD